MKIEDIEVNSFDVFKCRH